MPSDARLVRRLRPQLGTFVEVAAAAGALAEDAIHAAIDAGFDAIAEVQHRLSFHDPDSELSRLNRGAAIEASATTLRVLRLARALTRASGGRFNCTVGGALVACGALPDHGGVDPLAAGTADDIEISGCRVRWRRPVRVTLDGIAKGYAVDRAVGALRRRGVAAGWVNAGGDLRVFGDCTLPVVRREADGTLRPLGGLCNAALASSAVRSGRDPRFPALIVDPNGAGVAPAVWSVLAASAWRADALTKVAALAPAAARAQTVLRFGGRLIEAGAGVCA